MITLISTYTEELKNKKIKIIGVNAEGLNAWGELTYYPDTNLLKINFITAVGDGGSGKALERILKRKSIRERIKEQLKKNGNFCITTTP